jgi:predicted enzyme related to lactoylglutathione lyase
MTPVEPKPVVHLELHTGDLERACSFYAELCGWRPERIATHDRSYFALELGRRLGGGIVECQTDRPLWLPYVEVGEIGSATERARRSGGSVLLDSREGPAGWRSVITTPAGGEIALWQPKIGTTRDSVAGGSRRRRLT